MRCFFCERSFGDRYRYPGRYCTVCGHVEHPAPGKATYANIAFEDGQLFHVAELDEMLECAACGHKSKVAYYPCRDGDFCETVKVAEENEKASGAEPLA